MRKVPQYKPEHLEVFTRLISDNGPINRAPLLSKVKQFFPELRDQDLRDMKSKVNDIDQTILLGSCNTIGYFEVDCIDYFEKGLKQIEGPMYNLMRDKTLYVLKFKTLYPELYSHIYGQQRLNI
jgi:hypothetical protein